jgi:hypothetical protein
MTAPRDVEDSELDFDDDPTITFPAADVELAQKPQPLAPSGSRKPLLPVPVGH